MDLGRLGQAIRARREGRGLTQRALAQAAGLSVRFVAQIEAGEGNVSLLRFGQLARALDVAPHTLIASAEGPAPATGPCLSLVGVRGAGKSTIGSKLAKKLAIPFVELDAEIERAAEMPLAQIFELHGEAYYRRLERETLRHLLAERPALVIATGGSIVTDRESWKLLRERTRTVWLRARAEDHWNRVVAQGDQRPMKDSPHAFAELKALLAARAPLYATAAQTVDTSTLSVSDVIGQIADHLA